MYRPRHLAEFAALKSLSNLVNVLPQSAALKLGSVVASVGFQIGRNRRLTAEQRIRQVFRDLSEVDATRIARQSYRDLVWHLIEILRTPKVTRNWVEQNTLIGQDDRRRLDGAVAFDRGCILAVPHLANWDLAGIALEQLGYPMTFIYRNQKNPLFNRHLNAMRRYIGSETIERDDPMLFRKTIRSLRKGNIIAILVDLRSRQNDLKVPFLGHTADLARGLGLMAHVAGCPVLPAYTTRPAGGRLQLHFKESITPNRKIDRNDDAERILRATIPPLEAAIRANPEQYFWFNKRWVLEPIDGQSADGITVGRAA
ncbi:lysophospholipid acyltransferase family protein [Stieleria sp.]|uniref:lysophospholipid acyltransferase family protein n=1 Tax=Stieleria sp. TaxID=2795976 RepID=UPI003566FE12